MPRSRRLPGAEDRRLAVVPDIPSRLAEWTIRSAEERDVDAVLALWQRAGGEPTVTDTRDGLLRLLARGGEPLVIAEEDAVLVGSLIAAWDGWRGSFYRLAVDPALRRRGLATALVREGERRLVGLGAVRLTAIAIDEDPVALAFWASAGYTRQSHRARFVRHSAGTPSRR